MLVGLLAAAGTATVALAGVPLTLAVGVMAAGRARGSLSLPSPSRWRALSGRSAVGSLSGVGIAVYFTFAVDQVVARGGYRGRRGPACSWAWGSPGSWVA